MRLPDSTYVRRPPPDFPTDGVMVVPESELDTIDFDHVFIFSEVGDFAFPTEDGEIQYIDPESLIEEPEDIFLDNEFEIDSKELKVMEDSSNGLTEKFRNMLLGKSIARHMAFDTACSEVEAVMKSEYGSDVQVGNEPLTFIDCVGDLEVFEMLLEDSTLTESSKAMMLDAFIKHYVTATCAELELKKKNNEKSRRFRAELENYTARVNGEGNSGTQNIIGSVRSKSN